MALNKVLLTSLIKGINHANEGKVDKQKLAVTSYEKEPTPRADHENGFQKEFGVFVFVDRKMEQRHIKKINLEKSAPLLVTD